MSLFKIFYTGDQCSSCHYGWCCKFRKEVTAAIEAQKKEYPLHDFLNVKCEHWRYK